MLVIERQPQTILPNHLGHPIQWVIRKEDYLITTGEQALLGFSFTTDDAGADGQNFTILNEEFTTDSATPYTSSSFHFAADRAVASANFANMLRSNYLFVGWSIWIVEGGIFTVFAQRQEAGEIPGSTFVNDVSSLTPNVSLTNFAGTTEVVSTDRLWYQFWEDNQPISERKAAAFDPSGRARIEAEPLARSILRIDSPYLLWSFPHFDEFMTRNIYLKFGSYSTVDCNLTFNQVYESAPVTVINNTVQHNQLTGLINYHHAFTRPVHWLSARRGSYNICGTSYDFIAIYLVRSPGYLDGFYRVDYTFYDASDNQIATAVDLLSDTPDGVYHVPTGPANPINAAAQNAAAYWTVQVSARADGSGDYDVYSEAITVRKTSCSCKGAEIYYKEDLGSWRSIAFERIDSRELEIEGVEWDRPLQYSTKGTGYGPLNGIQIYHDGGESSAVVNSRAVYALVSERLADWNRDKYEQFLRSSHHYLLTSTDFLGIGTRPIIIDKGNYGIYRYGEATRLVIPFQFNTPQRTA